MKKILFVLALCASFTANAQDFAMVSGSGLTPVTESKATAETKEKAKAEYVFHTYGEIPVAKTAFEEEHFLGGELTKKWNTFIANYTHEYSVSVGLSNSGFEYIKPSVYNAVKRVNKYVKKAMRNNKMSRDEAVEVMSHVLDCANVICFESGTEKFEDAAKKAKTGEAVIELFNKVELVR